MAFVLAFSGKGGTGKTTLAGLTVRYIIEKKKQPVLAVDADANNCLNEVLGVDVHTTVGNLREDSLNIIRSGDNRPGGMSMEQLFDYQVQQSLVESRGFDLMVMGRPEGPGCYCAANNVIRKYTDKLSATYPYVVIDNEAGMEHLSRRTTHKVNILLIISDPTVRGIHTAKRIRMLVDELHLEIENCAVIINRASDTQSLALQKHAEEEGLQIAGIIPHDPEIAYFDLQGRPVFRMSHDAKALQSLFSILDSFHIP
jgi:CO dehydrogenase maturation factor